jgi:TetR/AcrR family transcriptional regulator, transcriptional repressor for nem operon
MPRTIAFDYSRAIAKATRLFWKNGYVGTSLHKLLKAMKIGEGSFYNTLKSKKQLYIKCLDHYEETEVRKRSRALMSPPTASQGIRAQFRSVLDCLDDPHSPSRLCMFAAMASPDVLSDRELRKRIEDRMVNYRTQIAHRLRNDRDRGLLPRDINPETIASIIATYQQGIWRMALMDYKRTAFEEQIDVFLKGLGL